MKKFNPKKIAARLLRKAKKEAGYYKLRTPQQKQKYLEGQARKMDNNPTGPEVLLIELLNDINVAFETQKIVHGKIFDFYIPSKNILVEVDGSYWHGYGLKYEEMNHIQRRAWKNDQFKDSIAKGLGFEILRIWEHELEDERFEECKERIRKLLT